MQRTFEFSVVLPNGGGCIRVTESGASETDARRAVHARYPGCNITSAREL
jgi:hypothetical protein